MGSITALLEYEKSVDDLLKTVSSAMPSNGDGWDYNPRPSIYQPPTTVTASSLFYTNGTSVKVTGPISGRDMLAGVGGPFFPGQVQPQVQRVRSFVDQVGQTGPIELRHHLIWADADIVEAFPFGSCTGMRWTREDFDRRCASVISCPIYMERATAAFPNLVCFEGCVMNVAPKSLFEALTSGGTSSQPVAVTLAPPLRVVVPQQMEPLPKFEDLRRMFEAGMISMDSYAKQAGFSMGSRHDHEDEKDDGELPLTPRRVIEL